MTSSISHVLIWINWFATCEKEQPTSQLSMKASLIEYEPREASVDGHSYSSSFIKNAAPNHTVSLEEKRNLDITEKGQNHGV